MTEAFFGRANFNEEIDGWDVASVTSMARMFHGASSFNQPVGSWDLSNVTSLQGMFKDASTFNQSLSDWNVLIKITRISKHGSKIGSRRSIPI